MDTSIIRLVCVGYSWIASPVKLASIKVDRAEWGAVLIVVRWCKSGILLYESNPQIGILLRISNIYAFHISSVPRSNMYQRLFEERDNGLTGLVRDRY